MDWSMAHWHDGDLRCEVFLFDDNPQFRVTLPEALVQRTFEHAAGCPVCRQGGKYETL